MAVSIDVLKAPIDCPFVYVGEVTGDIFFCFEVQGEACNFTTSIQDACDAVLKMGCAMAALYWGSALAEEPNEEAAFQFQNWSRAAFEGVE